MAEKTCEEKYPLHGSSGMVVDDERPSIILPRSQEDFAKALLDQKVAEERRDRNHSHNLAHNDLYDGLRKQLRALQTPVPSIAEQTEKANASNFGRTSSAIEEEKAEIELFDEGISIYEKQFLSPENKARAEQGQNIAITRIWGSESFPVRNYEEWAALIREKIAILKEVQNYHHKVLTIYETRLARLQERSQQEAPALLERAKAICREAKKLPARIEKAEQDWIKNNFTDFKSAQTFATTKEVLTTLEAEYYAIQAKLNAIASHETVTLPEFPSGPRVERASQIMAFYKSEVSRLEREKSLKSA